ncbi:hypothetical protein Tco_0260085 [Tanacetum coccineum]
MAKIQEVLPSESSSTDTPLEQENKTILKQLKKANASLTQELEKCKTNLDETNSALGEAISCRDSCLIALQNKQNEFDKYKAFNDRTIDYEILQTKLNETLGLLTLKDIEIKEGLKTKAYEISVLNQKHDELVKKSLLTKSQLEGYLKENTKVISDLKVKEDKDIDKMIEMDKQLKFLNEIVYTRNQSIQTIHIFAPDREETMTLDNDNENARTKKPNVVPISASKPKRKANKSVATPHKKTVASYTTIQKSKSYYKELWGKSDKMKEKGTMCHGGDNSTQSKGYRVYNKRTRLIVEYIHIKFDEIKEMMSDQNSSDLAPQQQEMSIENVSSGLRKPDSSHQGIEFLFSPLLEEYYNPTHDQAEENNNDQAPNASFARSKFDQSFLYSGNKKLYRVPKARKVGCQEQNCTPMSSAEARVVAYLQLCSINEDEDTTSDMLQL